MTDEKIFLPKLGESIFSANIVKILKKENEEVLLDEAIFEVATDKVTTEIPSPFEGVIKKILVKEGDEVKIGEEIAIISKKALPEGNLQKGNLQEGNLPEKEIFLSPCVKAFLKEKNISKEEVKNIPIKKERISIEDVKNYIASKQKNSIYIELTPIRKSIIDNMTKSQNIPCASLITEVDVTGLLNYILEKKEGFFKKYQSKLTITSFLVKAVALACEKFPHMNASFQKDKIEIKKDINLGIAVDIEEGLVVPNIKNCNQKSIEEIAKIIQEIAKKAKSNELDIEDIKDGTITVTNFGMGGAKIGIPVINYPQAAIIGIGVILEREKKKIINMSLTFDHRVADGMYSSYFLKEIKRLLESSDFYDRISF